MSDRVPVAQALDMLEDTILLLWRRLTPEQRIELDRENDEMTQFCRQLEVLVDQTGRRNHWSKQRVVVRKPK